MQMLFAVLSRINAQPKPVSREHSFSAENVEYLRMAVKLLCLCLLIALLCPSRAKRHTCLKSAASCDECIRSGPECAWCTAPHSNIRCHTMKGLQRAGCEQSNIYNPQGLVHFVKNERSTEPAGTKTQFIQPQEVSVRLRPGVSQSFHLTITKATDQPVPYMTVDISSVPTGLNITVVTVNSIQVTAEASLCPTMGDVSTQNKSGPWSVLITPTGFSLSVKLEISLECECDCTQNREESSSSCSGHGALTCGQCDCYHSYIGQKCQTDTSLDFSPNDDYCRSGPNAPVCSSRGQCVDGECECQVPKNPEGRYTGKYCECSNMGCGYANNRICGGHGRCECGVCRCDEGWTGVDCACSLEITSCMATNQQLCNGRGACVCGTCKCSSSLYKGPTCESCPLC